MRRESPFKAAAQGLLAVVCAIAIAIALGALWLALSLHVASARWWFALPAGIVMGYAARVCITRHRYWAMALAVPGVVLAAICMKCLYAGLLLAATMGLGFIDTLERAGIVMLLALARASLDPRVIVATLVGMALAAAVAWLPHRRERTSLTHRAP